MPINEKIVITGSTGFIGKRFMELYASKLNNLVCLVSPQSNAQQLAQESYRVCDLNNEKQLTEHLKDCKTFIHLAYDSSFDWGNIQIAKNIVSACKKNRVSRLVYTSSYVAKNKEAPEVFHYQSPYSVVKSEIEDFLKEETTKGFKAVVLQPGVVFGLGGNWSKQAQRVASHERLYLPRSGDVICPAVYVDDVCLAIYQGLVLADDQIFETSLIEYLPIVSEKPPTWRQFYEAHKFSKTSVFTKQEYLPLVDHNEFYANKFLETAFKFLLGKNKYAFAFFYSFLRKIAVFILRKKSRPLQQEVLEVSNVLKGVWAPSGYNRVIHQSCPKLDALKSVKRLKLFKMHSFNEAMELIKT